MLTFKIVVIGDTSVGKTSLVTRFAHKRFISHVSSTVGASFTSYNLDVDDEKIRLNIWDTAGQEKFRSMVSMYYRDAEYCLIVFDITNYNVDNLRYWITEYIEKTANPNPKFVLVGNKYDLLKFDFSLNSDLKKLMTDYNVRLFKTSALNGTNVDELFEHIGKMLLKIPPEQRLNNQRSEKVKVKNTNPLYGNISCCFP